MDESDLHIAVVFNLDKTLLKGDPEECIAIQYTANTSEFLYQAIQKLGYSTSKIIVEDSLEIFAGKLRQHSPKTTFIFNNCDGFIGENIGSVRVTRVMEDLKFKHTGAAADQIYDCIEKSRSKRRLLRAGVPTPPFQIFKKAEGEFRLKFPAIVKPVAEDASMGIDLDAVATNPEALFKRIDYITTCYCEPAIVEEYIVGREFAVAMWGNKPVEVLPVAEEDFGSITDPLKAFLTYESKWIEDSTYFKTIVSRPAQLPPDEEQRVKQVALNAFHAMGLRDFGRVDIRYRDGIPYVIDVNEIPDLSPESGFPRTTAAAGYSYEGMVEKILDIALRREGWRK